MKKVILRILLLICGLNVFTACYGMPPGEWLDPTQLPEEQEQTKAPTQPNEDYNMEESEGTEINESEPGSEKDNTNQPSLTHPQSSVSFAQVG